MAEVPCYLGSVNRWECDENDHLNVRFYSQKVQQALAVYLAGTDAGRMVSQHIRFVREARVAAPLRVDCVTVEDGHGGNAVLSLMRQQLTSQPIAAFTTAFDALAGKAPADYPIPEWAAPRGIDPAALYPLPADPESAAHKGFGLMGRGRVEDEECDRNGALLQHNYIGRISDGMPNLWAFEVEPDPDRPAGLGGAVVEYFLRYHAPLTAADIFRQLSGIRSFGRKTQHMVHLIFNETRGELALSAEAVGVAMDLGTRQAVPVSAARRRRLAPVLLR